MRKTVPKLTLTVRPRLLIVFLITLILETNLVISNGNDMTNPDPKAIGIFAENSKNFALKMMEELRALKPNENIVFSPLSVQTCAAMARVGSTGETAIQLNNGLGLISNDINQMADSFYYILKQYMNSMQLKIANKIYIMEGFKVKSTFNELLQKKFFTEPENVNFGHNIEAANTINAWVESKTNNLIKNLISPNAVNGDTRLVLLNAIHFKGEWVHKFRKYSTHEHDFYLNDFDTIKVQMMSQKERFSYADLPELDAKALEMPYKNTDLTMLIILPNSRTGLEGLLKKLPDVKLYDIMQKMNKEQVLVKIPKFKAEFQVELNEPFKKLGMTRMFSNSAEFDEMLDSPEELKVSKVIHKAFIDVNEDGTEAAAATGMTICLAALPLFQQPIAFTADRPFHYRIRNSQGVQFFTGNVITA